MNKLSLQKTCANHRPTDRKKFDAHHIPCLADCSINTVTKLLVDVGTACQFYQAQLIKNVDSKRVQCDEIWLFCYSKEKNIAPAEKSILGHGDAYTWTAINADTKLAIFS